MRALFFACYALRAASAPPAETLAPDVGVYGSTICAVTACVAAARMNASCAIVEPRAHLWGMTAGGLSGVDLRMPLGGVAKEIFGPRAHPNIPPSALNATMWALVRGAGPGAVRVVALAGGIARVERDGARIASVAFAGGLVLAARVFVDCSYDGDLLRLSNTSFSVGREAAAAYNESLGGVNGGLPWAASADAGVSPWADAANTTLIDGVAPLPGTAPGAADGLVQTYNYRVCVTNNASNRVPFAPPPGYAPEMTAFLRRWFTANANRVANATSVLDLFLVRDLGDGKYDINQAGGTFPGLSDMPNLQAEWPLGDWATRAAVEAAHETATRAAWEFLRTDAAVPALLRADAATFGLPADEFLATKHFPPQLYVREAVRMVGARVLSQGDVYGAATRASNSSVGLSQWLVDIHTAQRVALPPALAPSGSWEVGEAGGVNTVHGEWQLTEIPYEALTPRRAETQNLLVPVCASLTHVAFATYRLEPQYAVFGQSAAVAAVLAARAGVAVQDLDVAALRAELRAQGQLLDAAPPPADGPLSLAPCGGPSARNTWAVVAADGSVRLTAGGASVCASVFGYSKVEGAAIYGAACHTHDVTKPHNQAFDIVSAGAGVNVRSRLSGLCVVANGTRIVQAACAGAPAWAPLAGGEAGGSWKAAGGAAARCVEL